MTYLNHEPLKQASKALVRAADAAINATLHPNKKSSPCEAQMKAAKAEVDCALALIKQAEEVTTPPSSPVPSSSDSQ